MSNLHRAEVLALGILLTLGGVLWVLAHSSPVEVLWSSFLPAIYVLGAVLAFGLWFRLFGRLPRLATTLLAMGIFPMFTNLAALIAYLQFPFDRPLIDPLLLRIDAMLGYDWGVGVAWMVGWPQASAVMRVVYLAAIPQLGVLVLWLGLTGRLEQMHRLLLTGIVSCLATLAFWIAFPSIGPSAFVMLDPAIEAASGVLVTNAYGAHLLHLAEVGPEVIAHHKLLGMVAFPSFHVVMGLLAAWFARGTLLNWPFWITCAIMMPATALHGGHHLVDLFGGVAFFAASVWAVGRLLGTPHVITSGAVRPVRALIPASASTAAATSDSAA